MNGFNDYDEEHYFNDAAQNHNTPANGNGADFPAPVQDADFSEYMWMENEEEFDKEVLQRLEEEELMEQCMLQHMLDEPSQANNSQNRPSRNNTNQREKQENTEMAKSSTLNPHAAEFVPSASWGRSNPPEQKST